MKHCICFLIIGSLLIGCKKDKTAEKAAEIRYAASDNGLILRAGPATTTESLGSLPLGTPVTILEEGPVETIGGRTAAWQKVLVDGRTGYVFGGFLSLEEVGLPIRPADLVAHRWGPEHRDFGYYIAFNDDQTFSEEFAGEGCGAYPGKYKIESGRLLLEPADPAYFCARPPKSCILVATPDSLFSRWQLKCQGKDTSNYYAGDIEAGSRRSIDGIPVLTMGLRGAAATTQLKYRAMPETTAAEFSCKFESPSGQQNYQETPYIPQGTHMKVIARTQNQAKVEQWTNYWYYVRPAGDWYAGGCEPAQGWVFAEFVSLQN